MEHLLHAPPHQHVVFFTHNEQSHITPMFALARALASRGLQITCALPADSYAAYCSNNNITHNDATSDGIQVQPVAALAEHSDDVFMLQKKLQEGLVELLQSLQPPPAFLIADVMYCLWSQDVADRFGVTLFLFIPFLATTWLVACHIPELLRKGFLPFQPGMQDKVIDCIPGLMKGFRLADVPLDFLQRSSAELEPVNFLGYSKACAGLVMCSTSYALDVEAEALDALTALGLHVYPLAPMLQNMDWYNTSTVLYREDDKCMSFLDKHPRGSVVYASFGGIISLTKEEIAELVLGLEACGQPFLCVIRRVEGGTDVMSALPPGFLERIDGMGRIISWAPQMAVLSHPSVGCFLSHCGLASALEAIWTGVPVIGGFYKISDQNTVFKLMADGWKVALPLNMPHSALRKSIEEAIKEILQQKGGGASILKQQIVQHRDALREAVGPSGVSRHHFEQFVDVLLSCPAKQGIL